MSLNAKQVNSLVLLLGIKVEDKANKKVKLAALVKHLEMLEKVEYGEGGQASGVGGSDGPGSDGGECGGGGGGGEGGVQVGEGNSGGRGQDKGDGRGGGGGDSDDSNDEDISDSDSEDEEFEILLKADFDNRKWWPLSATGWWTVGTFKGQVKARMAVPRSKQRLLFKGDQLEDHRTLSSYGIHDGSVLNLQMGICGGGPGTTNKHLRKEKGIYNTAKKTEDLHCLGQARHGHCVLA